MRAFFSGDTIIDRRYWGSLALERTWLRFLYSRIDAEPSARWFWFLICKGYALRYLPIYFATIIPPLSRPRPSRKPCSTTWPCGALALLIIMQPASFIAGTITACVRASAISPSSNAATRASRSSNSTTRVGGREMSWPVSTDLDYGNLRRCALRMLGKVPVT